MTSGKIEEVESKLNVLVRPWMFVVCVPRLLLEHMNQTKVNISFHMNSCILKRLKKFY